METANQQRRTARASIERMNDAELRTLILRQDHILTLQPFNTEAKDILAEAEAEYDTRLAVLPPLV